MTLTRLATLYLMALATFTAFAYVVFEDADLRQKERVREHVEAMENLTKQCADMWPKLQARYEECLQQVARRYDF